MSEPSNPLHDERLAALYRAIPQVEPPEWLDQQILRAAKTQVEPVSPLPAAVRPKRRSARWAVPLALAATVVLSVGIVRLVRESGELATAPSLEAAKTTASPASQADMAPSEVSQAKSAEGYAHPPAASATAPATPMASPMTPPALAPPVPLAERAQSVDPKAAGSGQPPFRFQQLTRPEKPEKLNGTTNHSAKALADDKAEFRNSPESWLREIAKLRRQGETLKAQAEGLEFQRHYPNYPLEPSDADSGKP